MGSEFRACPSVNPVDMGCHAEGCILGPTTADIGRLVPNYSHVSVLQTSLKGSGYTPPGSSSEPQVERLHFGSRPHAHLKQNRTATACPWKSAEGALFRPHRVQAPCNAVVTPVLPFSRLGFLQKQNQRALFGVGGDPAKTPSAKPKPVTAEALMFASTMVLVS